MTIPFVRPKVQRDLKAAAFHGIIAAIEVINPKGPSPSRIAQQLGSAVKSLVGTKEDTTSNRAWIWALRTLTYAVGEMLEFAQRTAPLTPTKNEAIMKFIEASMAFEDMHMDALTIRNPGVAAAFEPARNSLPELILEATTGHDLGLDTLTERFAQALRTASNRVLCEDADYFSSLEKGLIGLAGEGARRDSQWSRHGHWLSTQFTDVPVFSPDEQETIPLEAIYLPLRCFWTEDRDDGFDENGKTKLLRMSHVADLTKEAHSWLSRPPQFDPVRVIAGGPGSGKSSFAKAFAHDVISRGQHRVAFVRLQFTRLTGSLFEDIGRYFSQQDNAVNPKGNPGLPGNPLDWRKVDNTPLLLIFDGLDELTVSDEDSKKYAREFLVALKLLLSPLNSDGSPVHALVLGRNIACEAAMKSASFPESAMLNVAPIAPMSLQTLGQGYTFQREKAENYEYVLDPDALMQLDQRVAYWQKWARVKGLDPDNVPKPITDKSMSELNLEPLLLHLLVISKYCGQNWEIASKNRNFVYEDILEKIFERNKKKDHFLSAGLDRTDFFRLMECLGIAAWRGNGRTGGDEEFRKVRKLHINDERRFRQFHAGELESVALNIHTRNGGIGVSDGFEFIHKSFGEYLAARGLLWHGLGVAEVLQKSEPDDVDQGWCELIGPAELTPEIIQFLYDEARRTVKSDDALVARSKLTEFLDWILINGASVHKAFDGLNWRAYETRQRCSEAALLAVSSAIVSCISMEGEKINDGAFTLNLRFDSDFNRTDAVRFLDRVGVTCELPVQLALKRINLSHQNMWALNFSRADLAETNFNQANLIRCHLIGTNMERASLVNCQLALADVVETNFCGCDCTGARFKGARFMGVSFEGANLTEADLSEIEAGKYEGQHTYFGRGGLNVKGSIDFKGAVLRNAHLNGANLSGALNLSLEAINSAYGNGSTILPDYIDRSKVIWKIADQ
jgi:uncharacterized protein YjbI with pentapeptide repeats